MEEANGARIYGVNNEIYTSQQSTPQESICKKCGCKYPSIHENLNYCTTCMTQLKDSPIPLWIKGAGLLVVVLLIYSAIQFPKDLKDYHAMQSAIATYQNEQYDVASVQFEALSKQYPNSKELAGWQFLSYIKTGNYDEAEIVANRLPDKMSSLSDSLQNELKPLLE